MPNVATRIISLIMLLQLQPNRKAAELAEELGVSIRTLHRYVNMLDEMGIPVCSERGPHGGFSLVRGYKMPPLIFSPEEAVSVYLGTSMVQEMWGSLYAESARSALAKLENVLPDEQRQEVDWARRTLLATHMHRADQDKIAAYLGILRRAIREKQQVKMRYRGRNQSQPVERKVDPYGLVHRWGWWYGVGHCHLRQAIRSFRVDRIVDLQLLEVEYKPPVNFDLQEYLSGESHTQPKYRVCMRFNPEAALLALDDRSYWETLEELEDGSVEVALTVPDLEWAARVALGYAPHAIVLEPDELRKMVQERARSIVAQYERISHAVKGGEGKGTI
jgi:predicted DNA-binding transcriptional regulator YafY